MRCSGKTTARMLMVLANAIEDPFVPVPFVDHQDVPFTEEHAAEIGRIASQIGLQDILVTTKDGEVWMESRYLPPHVKKEVFA